MAVSQAAAVLEKVMGHRDTSITEQDVTNPGRDRAKYADPSGEMMQALCWMGKNTVEMSLSPLLSYPPNPLSPTISKIQQTNSIQMK